MERINYLLLSLRVAIYRRPMIANNSGPFVLISSLISLISQEPSWNYRELSDLLELLDFHCQTEIIGRG